jgi:hypothetical protein
MKGIKGFAGVLVWVLLVTGSTALGATLDEVRGSECRCGRVQHARRKGGVERA